MRFKSADFKSKDLFQIYTIYINKMIIKSILKCEIIQSLVIIMAAIVTVIFKGKPNLICFF